MRRYPRRKGGCPFERAARLPELGEDPATARRFRALFARAQQLLQLSGHSGTRRLRSVAAAAAAAAADAAAAAAAAATADAAADATAAATAPAVVAAWPVPTRLRNLQIQLVYL